MHYLKEQPCRENKQTLAKVIKPPSLAKKGGVIFMTVVLVKVLEISQLFHPAATFRILHNAFGQLHHMRNHTSHVTSAVFRVLVNNSSYHPDVL